MISVVILILTLTIGLTDQIPTSKSYRQDLNPGQLVNYIWLDFSFYVFQDSFPPEYYQLLQKRDYPWTVWRQCDMAIETVERQVMGRKFKRSKKITDKIDLCKTCLAYLYGGTYADLDYEMDYQRHLKLIKEHDIFFITVGANMEGGLDVYYYFVREKHHPVILEVLQHWDDSLGILFESPHIYVYDKVYRLPDDPARHKRINTWHGYYIIKRQLFEIIVLIILGICIIGAVVYWKKHRKVGKKIQKSEFKLTKMNDEVEQSQQLS